MIRPSFAVKQIVDAEAAMLMNWWVEIQIFVNE